MEQEYDTSYGSPGSFVATEPERALLVPPARVVEAQTEQELFDVLSSTLRGLYRNVSRYQVYIRDASGDLVPALRRAGEHGNGLLKALKSRLLVEKHNGVLSRAQLCPALRRARRGSLMSALMLDGRSVIGVIVAESAPATADFTVHDVDALQGVAALFSLALQRLRSKERERLRASVDLDRKFARKVQRGLMSESLPGDIGVTVDAKYLPAFDVGGDFYELTYLGDGKIGGAIGDVSGKGVSAALIMSRVSSDFRRAIRSGVDPSTVLEEVNATLTDVESETFVTASCIRLDARRHKLTVANAGHLPLVLRRATGEVFSFGAPSGTPLGMMPCDYADDEIALEPRDIVLLMTDGLLDGLDRPGDRLGAQLLLQVVKSAPHDPGAVNGRVLEAANEMKGGRALDDMTLVALQVA